MKNNKMTSDIMFRHGDLGNAIEARTTIKLFPKSIYRMSLIWYYKNVKANDYTIPNYVFNDTIDEHLLVDFIKVSTSEKHFNDMDSKQIKGVIEIMYKLNYKNTKKIWDKLPYIKYTYDLVLIVKIYDSKKAAELTNYIDWGIRTKREFFDGFEKSELIDVVMEMSRSKKRKEF